MSFETREWAASFTKFFDKTSNKEKERKKNIAFPYVCSISITLINERECIMSRY